MSSLNALPSTDLLSAMNPRVAAAAAHDTTAAQDRFMKLLVTQMKYQDPLNPLDNAQVTGQLAQLSTVNGINKLNDTMQAMVQSVQGNQAMQAANLIGRRVMVPGSALSLSDGSAAFGIELSTPVDRLQLTISDAAGHPVRVMDLGAQQAGTLMLGWDGSTGNGGTAPDGRYQLQLTGTLAGQRVSAQPLVIDQVSSISTGSGTAASLRLISSQSSVKLSDVRQIL